MPYLWKVGMVVLVLCLVASMAIGIYRLATTPSEILGTGFRIHHPKAQQQPSQRQR